MNRLIIDVTGTQHQHIKAMAALQGKTIKDFVLEKIFADDEEKAMDELFDMLLARMEDNKKKGAPQKTFDQVTKEILENNE